MKKDEYQEVNLGADLLKASPHLPALAKDPPPAESPASNQPTSFIFTYTQTHTNTHSYAQVDATSLRSEALLLCMGPPLVVLMTSRAPGYGQAVQSGRPPVS